MKTLTNPSSMLVPLSSSLLAVHHLLMCARGTTTMARKRDDDGGLRDALRAAERVSNDLASSFSSSSSSSSCAGGGGMDLSRRTYDELRTAVAPMVRALGGIDAAALLSLTPVAAASNDDAEEEEEGEDDGMGGGGAVLDPARGLTVSPIHGLVSPPPPLETKCVVRYLHVGEVPGRYSAGIFVFPPGARMPLHDHPNMVVLSRVLYGELGVTSYDVVADSDDRDENDRTDAHRDDADGDDVDPEDGDACPRRSALRASLARIRAFVLNRAFSFRNDDGEVDGGGATRNAAYPVLRARPNLNPMGASRRRRRKKRGRGGVEGGGDDGDGDPTPEFVLTAPNVTCLYPREGNCHAFVAGPNGAAVLDVLFPPYDEDDGRDCTYYERRAIAEEDDGGDGERRRTLVALVPVDRPDDFDCLGGSYGCIGSD
jgi:hypothetical protein